jgi:hypothetical protein
MISRATVWVSSWFERALMTTAAPAAASSSAIARPMFRPAPVTRATLPVSSWGFIGGGSSQVCLASAWSCLRRGVVGHNARFSTRPNH